MTDLLHPRTRNHFLLILPNVEIKYIRNAFESEGFVPDFTAGTEGLGERKALGKQLLAAIDWTDHDAVRRAITAFEQVLLYVDRNLGQRFTFMDEMAKQGYDFDADSGEFTSRAHGFEMLDAMQIPDLKRYLERIRTSIDKDPALAIGSAKEVSEAVAKTVLVAQAVEISSAEKFPALIRKVNDSLGLAAGPKKGLDGTETIVKTLGALTTLVLSIAELRNTAGTGHGAAGPNPGGLTARHARLAVNAAAAWCEFVVETLNDTRAPWRASDTC